MSSRLENAQPHNKTSHPQMVRLVGYNPSAQPGGISNYSHELARRMAAFENSFQLGQAEVRQLFQVRPFSSHDLVHFPKIIGAQALLTRRYKRSVVTVHDLGGLLCPLDRELQKGPERFVFKLALRGLRQATHLLADSEYTRDCLVQHLGINSERISVSWLGVDHTLFQPRPKSFARQLLSEEIGLDLSTSQPVLLYVGSELPRKNLKRLWAALARLRQQHPQAVVLKVGLPGGPATTRSDTRREIAAAGLPAEAVRFLDMVEPQHLAYLYNAADIFVQPSLYEGFSFPTAESMASGCPVVAARATCLPEVVGEAGAFFNPLSTEELAVTLLELWDNPDRQLKLVGAGPARAVRFDWQRTVEQVVQVYRKVAGADISR